MKLEKTKNTPFVNLSITDCVFEITGDSYYEEFTDIYDQILKWIEEEMPKLECEINCVFHFGVLNSISLKNVIIILLKLNHYYKTGKKISITWYYDKDDEDNEDNAEDLSILTEIPFKIVAVTK